MNMTKRRGLPAAILILLFAVVPASLLAQTAPATSVANYPGAGVLQAGDNWESFLPQTVPSYSETGTFGTLGIRNFLRFGNYDRSWTTPSTHWPNAYPYTFYWFKNAMAVEYNPDPTFNPASIGGQTNPSYFANSGVNYGHLTFKSTLNGANDPNRNYTRDPYWVDGTRRQHAVYEAAWPTNVGIDVKVRAHAFQGPNWNNLNDFVVIEIEMKNTGYLDMNMDGVAEKLNNEIKALAFIMTSQSFMSISSYGGGGRNRNDIVPTPIARQAVWVNDNDPNGSPWAFSAMYTSASVLNPAAGSVDIGFNSGALKNYTDVWTGWVMLDVRRGGLPADRSKGVVTNPIKETVFGTHPIGVGAERGWYVSGGSSPLLWTLGNPQGLHVNGVGAFYVDGGKSRATSVANLNLNPNPNYFASGTAGNLTTFVPKPAGSRTRPNGDFKSSDLFDQVSFEDGKADATTNYPNGWGKFSKGASNTENFNGDLYSSVGPFSIPKDSSITIVYATVAGYRLEGIQRSVRAARWAYEQNYNLPQLPPLPDVKVSNTLSKSVNVEWDTRAESDAGFAGYKVWKSSQHLKKSFLDEGMRIVDRYQEQMTLGTIPANLKKPINPKFDAFGQVNSTSHQGTYQPDTWGTWDLVAVIPKANLASVPTAASAGYKYRYEDKDVVLGFSYWYYVSAYKEGTFTGPGGETTDRIETHSTNRNGATGLWNLTYPFATLNANFGKILASDAAPTAQGLKNIGAVQVVYSALAPAGSVGNVGVRPNPYKRAALHDNRANVYDHKLLFYNLPPQCTITIVDVAGQVIDVINFSSSDANRGSTFWDMFSKDGIEVASGLYIYIVESPTGDKKVGQFSIIR